MVDILNLELNRKLLEAGEITPEQFERIRSLQPTPVATPTPTPAVEQKQPVEMKVPVSSFEKIETVEPVVPTPVVTPTLNREAVKEEVPETVSEDGFTPDLPPSGPYVEPERQIVVPEESADSSYSNVPEDVFSSLIHQESRGNPAAVSHKGAFGMTQVMPGTWTEIEQELGTRLDKSNPEHQKLAGKHYLSKMLNIFNGDMELALAGYNAGPGRVEAAIKKAQEIGIENPTFENIKTLLPEETQNYVPKVLSRANVNEQDANSDALITTEVNDYKNKIREQAAIKAIEADEIARQTEEIYQQKKQTLTNLQDERDFLRTRIDEQLEKQNEIATQIQNQEYDPKAWWSEKSTGEKIILGVSVALGLLGTALQLKGGNTRAPNYGLNVIQTAIDQDLRRQKLQFEKNREDFSNSQNLLSNLYKQTDNIDQAMNLAQEISLNQAKNEILKITNKYKSPKIQQQAEVALSELSLKQDEVRKQRLFEIQKEAQKQFVKDRPLYIDGYGKAASEKEAQKARELISSTKSVNENLTQLKDIFQSTQGFASNLFNPTLKSKAQALTTQIYLQLKETNNLGVLAGPDMDLLKDLLTDKPVSNWTQWSKAGTLSQINTLMNLNDRNLNNYLKAVIPESDREQNFNTKSTRATTLRPRG